LQIKKQYEKKGIYMILIEKKIIFGPWN